MSAFGDGEKLDIRDGWIAYKIYAQDGTMIPMSIVDTTHNRRFVEWVQIHDRCQPAPPQRFGDEGEGR